MLSLYELMMILTRIVIRAPAFEGLFTAIVGEPMSDLHASTWSQAAGGKPIPSIITCPALRVLFTVVCLNSREVL